MPEREDHEQLSDRLEREADKLARESENLGQEIRDAWAVWEATRRDPTVAGAVPPSEDEPPSEDDRSSGG